ncbi:OLC1v1010004C1 [Oldenlandia corymbosa var. corymbosa]|uniref:OLC1v1010004C1 n=1 Tax=Oldenlandia corymbosa var. corymbosa TaxID=529605 RepID=A0AAV1DRV1_OLDCO|nr:OLC1v1010004C1 [Oldenlandia corymbosa var. corymbosa]
MMGYEGVSAGELQGLGVAACAQQRSVSRSFPDDSGLEEDKLDAFLEASHRLKLDEKKVDDSVLDEKKQSSGSDVQNSLRQEIMQLEKRLQDQVAVRCALEKALGYKSSHHSTTTDVTMPKPATELIKEISVLEVEVGHLEQYLLSLYRKAFDPQISSVSPSAKNNRTKSPLTTPRRRRLEFSRSDMSSDMANMSNETSSSSRKETIGEERLLDSSVLRCHSSLSQCSAPSSKTSPPPEPLGKALRACYSQPLSMMEYAQNTSSNVISLAEHLGTRISDHITESPNKISEDMVKCMSTIYCKLADPPLTNIGLSSPTSSLSSISGFSPKDQCDMWSPGFRNDSSFDVRLDNPFHVEGLKEFSGPYSTMVEVQCLYRDSQKLGDTEHLLENFRSLISKLEDIDPRKMTHEEKLAFWINIHNALVMHAILAYGIPQNNMKRVFLLLKAAYNVGGHVVSADVIQNSILGCRMSRPGQWLRLLLLSKSKFKAGDERQGYAIERSEPLLHFALCSGNHSDPAVRVYTPKRVIQEMEAAKEEYIRATFGVRKDQKILLPKLVENFAKDSAVCTAGLLEMIQKSLPESLRRSIKKHQLSKSKKCIEWIPHNFAFRYLIMKELAK